MPTSLQSAVTRAPDPMHSHPPTRGAEVVTRDGRSLPLVSARLFAEAQGGIARVVLEQRFENRQAETLHVTYRMPLPADGAVSGYAFEIAERTIAGRVDRKRAARERFEQAIASGKTAALLEQERADIFTQSIGNLPAGEALTARITIDQKLVWLPEGEWELRFPTVIGPRYISADDGPAAARSALIRTQPEGVAARIQLAIKIADALVAGRKPASPSHALQVGGDGVVELRDIAGAKLDRDIVVRWPVAGAAVGLSLAVARPPERDDAFGLLTIVPPARAARAEAFVRDLIVLIDTSGSMDGGPLDKAKQVVAMLIESLGDEDRLELIEFSSQPRRYRASAMPATRAEKHAAIRWLRGLTAGGGTEMHSAVIEAMRTLRPGSQRQVVLATDGYIGGEERIVGELRHRLPRSCRLHVLGVGSSVNRALSTAMARAGRGAEVVCDLDEDAERAARRIIDRTRMPVLINVTIAGSALIAQAPELLPDVYEGSPFVAAVKLRPGELVVRGELARDSWEQRLVVGHGRTGTGNQAIAALFGREHVADLETRGVAGDRTDAAIERAGLEFQIATRFTSWIAVDELRTVTGPSRHQVMPQALPYGTTASAFGLREPAPDPAAGRPFADVFETVGESGGEPEFDEKEIIGFDELSEVRAFDAGTMGKADDSYVDEDDFADFDSSSVVFPALDDGELPDTLGESPMPRPRAFAPQEYDDPGDPDEDRGDDRSVSRVYRRETSALLPLRELKELARHEDPRPVPHGWPELPVATAKQAAKSVDPIEPRTMTPIARPRSHSALWILILVLALMTFAMIWWFVL